MIKIKSLKIAGIRGIRTPLSLPMSRDGSPTSVIIFGRNGTGKSSIADAWEWFRTGKIEYLAREGAGEQAYPNRGSGKGESYVEVEFTGTLGKVESLYDVDRIRQPKRTGAHQDLAAASPHPCHIRFADVTRFVYLSKTERYDLLAQFMGFTAQVDFLKALRRVQRQLGEARNLQLAAVQQLEKAFKERVRLTYSSEAELCTAASVLLERHALVAVKTFVELKVEVEKMKVGIASDPSTAQALALKDGLASVKELVPAKTIVDSLTSFETQAVPFKERAAELQALAMLSLYRTGKEALEKLGETDSCPLCGQFYDGNLSEHIASELKARQALQKSYDETAAALKALRAIVATAKLTTDSVEQSIEKLTDAHVLSLHKEVLRLLKLWNTEVESLSKALPEKAESLDTQTTEAAAKAKAAFTKLRTEIETAQKASQEALTAAATALTTDAKRLSLVEDFQVLSAAVEIFPKYEEAQRLDAAYVKTSAELDTEITDFSDKSVSDVESRFATISKDVGIFFGILEQDTPSLSSPSLKILYDQERAVVLEVVFHGTAIAPAYKYLSESQLNSFGLAVFLASVRRFNPEFGFVLLDDVVNSLDAYKRPYLIDLLKQYFDTWQVVVLTHDTVWRDRLIKQLPSWQRVHFRRHDVGTGPVQADPNFGVAEVNQHLDADKPKTAGQVLGPLIEADLQEICEALEAPIKYRRYNDHTLDPLLTAARTRLESKLGSAHPVAILARDLDQDTGFRNLCAHAKDPDADITAPEVSRARDKWLALVSAVTCSALKCGRVARWADPVFRCPCGTLVLAKLTPPPPQSGQQPASPSPAR